MDENIWEMLAKFAGHEGSDQLTPEQIIALIGEGGSIKKGERKNIHMSVPTYMAPKEEDQLKIDSYNDFLTRMQAHPAMENYNRQMDFYNEMRKDIEGYNRAGMQNTSPALRSLGIMHDSGGIPITQLRPTAPPEYTPPKIDYMKPLTGEYKNFGVGLGWGKDMGAGGGSKKTPDKRYLPVPYYEKGSSTIEQGKYDHYNPGESAKFMSALAGKIANGDSDAKGIDAHRIASNFAATLESTTRSNINHTIMPGIYDSTDVFNVRKIQTKDRKVPKGVDATPQTMTFEQAMRYAVKNELAKLSHTGDNDFSTNKKLVEATAGGSDGADIGIKIKTKEVTEWRSYKDKDGATKMEALGWNQDAAVKVMRTLQKAASTFYDDNKTKLESYLPNLGSTVGRDEFRAATLLNIQSYMFSYVVNTLMGD
jgi:hypothetical protein